MRDHQTLLSAIVSLALLLLTQGTTLAQQEQVTEAAPEETEKLRPIVELGRFEVKDFRPSQNETVKLIFHIHVALNKAASKQTVEQLEFWKHRLRNQVIVAVRLSGRQDFLETGLQRFRRIVQIRINRVLKTQLVDEVLLTEFIFTTN